MNQQTWQPPETDRIRNHTTLAGNDRIDRKTSAKLAAVYDSPLAIRARLAKLATEWNVDRAVMLNFTIAGAVSAAMAMRNLKRTGSFGAWGVLFWTQLGFLANHTVRGWCPPMPIFRRLGFRSANEIAAERSALELRLVELESL